MKRGYSPNNKKLCSSATGQTMPQDMQKDDVFDIWGVAWHQITLTLSGAVCDNWKQLPGTGNHITDFT